MAGFDGMTEQQATAVRELDLELRATLMDGTILVRDPERVEWVVTRAGDLEAYVSDRGRRVSAVDL
jgi:hypothetical protein